MSKARQLADLGNVYDDGALSSRNMVTNGAMTIAQRGVSGTTTGGTGLFICDRFFCNSTGTSVFTYEQSSDAPDGFTNSSKLTVSTSQALQSNDYSQFHTKIEGYDAARLGLGTANAKTFTLSFWVKSSLTGTFGIMFGNGPITMRYVTSYQINSANTWEYKTITVAGATSGSFGVTNDVGLYIYYDMGVGTNYSTSNPNQWGTGFTFGLTGGVKLKETSGATWQITGVQLEVGDTATPFEHRSYGDELARCQRYYETFPRVFSVDIANSTSSKYVQAFMQVEKRAVPTVSYSSLSEGTFANRTADTKVIRADHYSTSGYAYVSGLTADAEL
jgi:hypothetical protein